MSATATEEPPVVRDRVMPRKKRDDQTVKIDRQIAEWADYVARSRKDANGDRLTVAEYLSELLRATVHRDYRETISRLNAALDELPPVPRKRKGE